MEDSVNSSEPSAYASLYKNSGKTLETSLQERVTSYLSELKEKRHNAADKNRNFSEVFFGTNDSVNDDYLMECDELRAHRKRKKLQFKLMKSEWFIEVPEALMENWFIKICPDGFRVLIVAENSTTVCYARSGKVLFYMKTNLPGGGKVSARGLTVLDCVYQKTSKTIFVVDCLCWNSLSMLNSEVAFRFYWLRTKFDESPELVDTNKNFKFFLLDYYVPDISFIQEIMSDLLSIGDHRIALDGMVMYHKEGHYSAEVTPLVGFIPSFGLAEVMQIDVHPKNLLKKPKDYTTLQEYIEETVHKTKNKSESSMETEIVE